MKTLLACCIAIVTVAPAFAQPANTLIYYNFHGSTGEQPNNVGTALYSGLTAPSIARSSGINGTTISNGINSYGWTTDTAIRTDQYYSIQFSWEGINFLNLSSLQFRTSSDPNGPKQMELQYSLDNFLTPGTVVTTQTIQPGITIMHSIDLSGFASLQNVSNAQTVEFRLYGYRSQLTPLTVEEGMDETLARQMGFVNTASSSTSPASSGVFITGTIVPVPEPGWIIALAAAGSGLARVMRKSKRTDANGSSFASS